MNKFKDFFNEMALTDLKKIGKWDDKKNRHGYDKASIGILSSDAGIEKIKQKFDKIDIIDLNLYFLKDVNASKHVQLGEVTPEFVKKTFNLDIDEPESDQLTVIFTNNSAAEKVPLTYWTIAHRMGHTLYTSSSKKGGNNSFYVKEINKLIKNIFRYNYNYDNVSDLELGKSNPLLRNLLETIGKFRSARHKQLPRTFEFVFECFAQFLLSNGNLSFNPLPKSIPLHNKKMYGKPYASSIRMSDGVLGDQNIDKLTYLFENMFNEWIEEHRGTIVVM
jgi:hypothetical protein